MTGPDPDRDDFAPPPATLEPGAGSPAALAAAARLAPTQPRTATPQFAPPAPQGGDPQPGLSVLPDGMYQFVDTDGSRQLIPAADLPVLLGRATRYEREIPELQTRAKASDDLLALVGADPAGKRLQQLTALVDHWQTGRALPPDPFGFAPVPPQRHTPPPAPGRGGWFDDPEQPGTPPPAAPDPRIEALERTIAEQQRTLQALQQGRQQETAAQREAQLKLDARSRLEAYSFLKANPRALEDALRRVVDTSARDPRLGVDTIVRQVATDLRDILAGQQQQMLEHARTGGPQPIASNEGIPFPSTQRQPLTAEELRLGKGVQRLTERIQGWIGNRAAGTHETPPS